jgi:hypothetical protein
MLVLLLSHNTTFKDGFKIVCYLFTFEHNVHKNLMFSI